MKEFHVRVCSYKQINYTIRAKTLKEAKERYGMGEYDSCYEGGPMDGETVNEDWEEV